jgi:hypothetical protein
MLVPSIHPPVKNFGSPHGVRLGQFFQKRIIMVLRRTAGVFTALLIAGGTLGLHAADLQSGQSEIHAKRNLLVLVTVAESRDTNALILRLTDFRRISGNVSVIVFDNGLSSEDKARIEDRFTECEIRPCRKNQTSNGIPNKSEMILDVVRDRYHHGIIAWADVGHLPDWDLSLILDRYPVGISFVGELSNDTSNYPGHNPAVDMRIDYASSRFFAIFSDLRFYYQVLLPWNSCATGASCPILSPNSNPAVPAVNSSDSFFLSRALTAFRKSHRRSVSLKKKLGHGMRTNQEMQRPAPALSRILATGLQPPTPFIGCVTLFGPNNQLITLLYLASLARKLGVRFLAPPLRPHHLKTARPDVSQDSAQIPAEHVFSLHFLYQSAVIADPSSSWADLLPLVDLIVHKPPGSFTAVRCRKGGGNCTLDRIMKDRNVGEFLRSVGVRSRRADAINVVVCDSDPEECVTDALRRRQRIPILLWHNIAHAKREVRSMRRGFPTLSSGHFQVPRASLERSIRHQRPCLALQIRLQDAVVRNSTVMVGSVPASELMRSKCSEVMIRNQWGERTLADLVATARSAASRRNLTLYVLMPFHKPVFDRLARMRDVTTIQSFNLQGMSELEVLLSDMAMAAACDLFVPDAFSSVTSVVTSMRGGVGLLSPQRLAREGGRALRAAAAGAIRQRPPQEGDTGRRRRK